ERFNLFQSSTDSPGSEPPVRNDFGLTSNNDNRQTTYALRASYEIDDGIELELRGSFLDNTFIIPNSNPLFDFTQDNETLSGEALLRIEDVGFVNRAVFGVAYDHQTDVGVNDVAFFPISFDGEIYSIGIFGEIEFGLTDQLALIAGGRLEIDDRQRLLTAFGQSGELDISETAFIPKIGLRYDFNDDASIGYQYTEGYRPGGIDFDLFDPAAGIVTYDSERLRQHEIYGRARLMDDRLSIGASIFYYDFDDAQTFGANPNLFGNVPEARGFGGELEAAFEVIDGLTVSGGIGFVDTKITDPGPNLAAFDGDPLPRSSEITASAAISYVSPWGFDARASVNHVGSRPSSLGFGAARSYTVVDLAAGYEVFIADDASFRIEAFVNNVGDERVTFGNDGGIEVLGRPRTFGIGGTFRF
ncbi:MAG: TonB-dependent receptor, partial [Pseudomonadota bacterium]